MSKRQATPKTLFNMPDEVRQSAWDMPSQVHWRARLLRLIDGVLEAALKLYSWASWVALLVLLMMVVTSYFGGKKEALRDATFVAVFYLFGFGVGWLSQWNKVVLRTPRLDREYPLVASLEDWRGQVRMLTIHASTAALAFWAWIAVLPASDARHILFGAVLQTLSAAALVVIGLQRVRWGRRVPSDAEIRERSRRYMKGLETSATPDDYPLDLPVQHPDRGFNSIHGMVETKSRLWKAAQEIQQASRLHGEAPRNGILLHGAPGNGKTVFVAALAGELGIPLVTVTYGTVSSKWKGETARMLMKCFALARAQAPCVFFLDEIDSMIRQRGPTTHDEDVKITNVLLTEIVALRSHPVILVAATNFLDSLDSAAIREGRFDYKVEVPPPDYVARLGILQSAVQKHVGRPSEQAALESVAKRWEGYSVSRLVAVAKAVADQEGLQHDPITFDDWAAALRAVQGSKGRDASGGKRLDELILSPEVAGSLQSLAARMTDIEASEALGANLPRGVLFFGPPGTGKTAAARALAKASDWAFLPAAGPDFLNEPEALQRLMQQAADLRPALIFIDEADDLLRSRSINPRPELVNRLLTLMDGVGHRMQDVVLVAATNHPDQVDEALLRAGRFTEKIHFAPPTADGVALAIGRWLAAKRLSMPVAQVDALAARLEGTSLAAVEGVLQHSLNAAVHRALQSQTAVQITWDDVEGAIRVVAPDRY